MLSLLFFAITLFASIWSGPIFCDGVIAPFQSPIWNKHRRAQSDDVVPLVLGIKAQDEAKLENVFWERSNPLHPNYGRYLTREEADELSSPSKEALESFDKWLSPHSVSGVTFSPHTNTIRSLIQVSKLENLFNTSIHEFQHPHLSKRILRATNELSFPSSLVQHIQYCNLNTHPLGLRMSQKKKRNRRRLSSNFGENEVSVAVPKLLRKIYSIPADRKVTNESNTQAIGEFYEESWSRSDLDLFLNKTNSTQPFKIVQLGDRENIPSQASGEASLDIQYIVAMAPNSTTYVWTMNGSNPYSSIDEPFLEWAEAVLKLENPPLVHSMSYSDDEEHIFIASASYARSLDKVLMKMGARGLSVLFSSGDDGVAGLRPSVLHLNESQWCSKAGPQWPTSSPYVTVVGATMIPSRRYFNDFFYNPVEVVCSRDMGGVITTGGGFSNQYAMPDYQRDAVNAYLASDACPKRPNFFNASGRGYPDISALGSSYLVYILGDPSPIAGTSASAPVIAAMVTLWNDRRMNAGKPPLGFLNPILYSVAKKHPEAFNDVVLGNNAAGQRSALTCPESFRATYGWDASTGLGTPKFDILDDILFDYGSLQSQGDLVLSNTNSLIPSLSSAPLEMGNIALIFGLAGGWIIVIAVGIYSFMGKSFARRFEYDMTDLKSGKNGGTSNVIQLCSNNDTDGDTDTNEETVACLDMKQHDKQQLFEV